MSESVIAGGEIHNTCPVDLRRLPAVPVATIQQIFEAVAHAHEAQRGWEEQDFKARARALKRGARRMIELRQEALELLHDEAGKTPGESLLGEAIGALQYVSDWIKVARVELAPKKLPIPALAFPRKKAWTEAVPRGVVAVIAPWNYPVANFFKPVFAALLCGNSVVIKPSEYSPRSALWFAGVLNEFLPPGVLSVVLGGREVGQDLVKAGVNAVTFTGSWASGREVAALAARQTIPCSVELGGKDAAIVLSDCDLDRTVAGIMHWSLHNAGQACGDIERVFVEESIADEFARRLASAVGALRAEGGDPAQTDIGPLVHEAQLHVVEDHVADAVARGARVLCGGKRASQGLWYLPTVLDGCDSSMKVMNEPTFGPVIPISRVPDSKGAEEAIRRVNDCEYGLNASIWSRDLAGATRLARRLQVGTAFVNNHAFTGALPAAPWTGVKRSGYGIANSRFAIYHYTRPRTIVVDRKRSADGWWFPMDRDAVELGHCLAEAQLGGIRAALKIPFLMARRQRTAMRFAREGKHAEVVEAAPRGPGLFARLGSRLVARLGRFWIPLSKRELRWGVAVMRTIYAERAEGDARKLKDISRDEADAFLQDLHANLPFSARWGSRAALWVAGLAPVYSLYRLRSIDDVSEADRLKIIEGFIENDSYIFRQLAFLLKMNASLSYAATTRFRLSLGESLGESLGAPAGLKSAPPAIGAPESGRAAPSAAAEEGPQATP